MRSFGLSVHLMNLMDCVLSMSLINSSAAASAHSSLSGPRMQEAYDVIGAPLSSKSTAVYARPDAVVQGQGDAESALGGVLIVLVDERFDG